MASVVAVVPMVAVFMEAVVASMVEAELPVEDIIFDRDDRKMYRKNELKRTDKYSILYIRFSISEFDLEVICK